MAKISLEERTRIHPCARTECLEVRALNKDKLDAPTQQRCLSYRRMGTVRKTEQDPKPKARGQKLKKYKLSSELGEEECQIGQLCPNL